MPRARIGAARNRKRTRILKEARGYYGRTKNHRYLARNAVRRAGSFAYRDRRARKRDMRSLWITRITAACRMRASRYSQFVSGLKMAGITLNRKMLSQLAIEDPKLFDRLVATATPVSRAAPASA